MDDYDYNTENPMRAAPRSESDGGPLKPILYDDQEQVDLDFLPNKKTNKRARHFASPSNDFKSFRGKKRSNVSNSIANCAMSFL
jgi:hypothetical protein